MTQYKATYTTNDGQTHTMKINAGTIQQAEKIVKTNDNVGTYEIQSANQQVEMAPDNMAALYRGTGGLMFCIIFMVYAEYRIRKWCKGE